MRVSDSAKVLFVHVPKTAGSTIDRTFDEEIPDSRRLMGRARHSSYRGLLKTEPELAGYWAFGFVRNPWDRMVSWWSMIHDVFENYEAGVPAAVRKIENHPDIWLPGREYKDDFERFVLEGTEAVPKFGRPMLHRLTADSRRVDFVGRQENFHEDFNKVRLRLGLAELAELPRVNVSRRSGHYSEFYNARTRDQIAKVYAEDIEAFGYEFEG